MVHHVVLCKLNEGLGDPQVEWIIRQSRIRLLKITEVRAIKCGKRIGSGNDWGFFYSADYESMDKMALGQADPVYRKFVSEVITPHVREQLVLSYEVEPGKDTRYS